MSMTERDLEPTAFAFEELACKDEECDGIAEQEKDGDYMYWVCQECGFSFGYEKLEAAQIQGGACSIGVPQSLQEMGRQEPTPVKLTIKSK